MGSIEVLISWAEYYWRSCQVLFALKALSAPTSAVAMLAPHVFALLRQRWPYDGQVPLSNSQSDFLHVLVLR